MPNDLTIKSEDLAVTMSVVAEILRTDRDSKAGCGLISAGRGVFHLLVQDVDSARRILESHKLPVSEEGDTLVIIAEDGDHCKLNLNGAEKAADNIYIIKVPDNGSVKVTTTIEARDDNQKENQDPQGCSHIIFDILHRLKLTK